MATTETSLDQMLAKRAGLKGVIEQAERELQEVNDWLGRYVDRHGVKEPSGSTTLTHGTVVIQHQSRHQRGVKQWEAIALLTARSALRRFSHPLITEDDLIRAVQAEVLTEPEAEGVRWHKTVWAISVRDNLRPEPTPQKTPGGILWMPDTIDKPT